MNRPSLAVLESEMNQLAQQFPSTQLPPNCFGFLKTEFVEYVPPFRMPPVRNAKSGKSRTPACRNGALRLAGTMLKVIVPVFKESLNPMGAMQGGIITAAFDNTFGPLSYLAARNPCITLDLHTNFIRPAKEGEVLTITARVISRSPVSLHLSGEAVNEKGKLIATCTSQMVVTK
jgi:uncharacterized protein (TIGR00369 family)